METEKKLGFFSIVISAVVLLVVIPAFFNAVYAQQCGNGIRNQGEQCDDGNQLNNDACTNECTLTFCGDGIKQMPNGFGQNEQCDDGNFNNLDLCRNCMLPRCGDNVKDQGEQCDDGNNANGDGCSSTCMIEGRDKIRVCKVIIDPNGTVVNGSEFPNASFSISGINPNQTSLDPPIGVFPNTTFTTPLLLNADLLLADGTNDAQCILYSRLKLGGYYYGEENFPSIWEEPKYNDQHVTPVFSTADFFEYDSNLFDGNPGNDGARNTDADGHVFLNTGRPMRTIVVLNQYLTLCGNNIVDENEQCDDGNNIDGDGCSAACKIECIDLDMDGVCDSIDRCPDSEKNATVDQDGCDHEQFCEQFYCSPVCFTADFLGDEGQEPNDCKVVIIHKEGIPQPKCVPIKEVCE